MITTHCFISLTEYTVGLACHPYDFCVDFGTSIALSRTTNSPRGQSSIWRCVLLFSSGRLSISKCFLLIYAPFYCRLIWPSCPNTCFEMRRPDRDITRMGEFIRNVIFYVILHKSGSRTHLHLPDGTKM